MSTEMTPPTTATPVSPGAKKTSRRKKKTEGRKKRTLKLRTNAEFAKQYFEAKSKRSTDKKSAFRKKKTRKK